MHGKTLRMYYHMRKSRKRMLWQAMKSCVGWYQPRKILNSSSKIHFTWFNRINFKLILLTLIFKSLFFKRQTLTATTFVIWYIFNWYAIGGLCKYVLSKKIKTDIFNKSVFANKKLIIIIIYSRNVWRIIQTWSLNT